MSGLINKMKDLILGEDYEDEEYDEYEGSEQEMEREVPTREMSQPVRETQEYTPQTTYGRRRNGGAQVVSIQANVQMQVVVVKLECYEDAQEICDQIKSKKPVVVNLEKVEYPIAQRIMDFLSGTCYSLDGTIQRVANNIFIIAPENVDISGDFKEELKTKGVILPWVKQ